MGGRVIQGFFIGGAMRPQPAPRAEARPAHSTGAPPPAFAGRASTLQARMAPGRPPLAHQGAGQIAQRRGGNGSFEIDPVQLGLARGGGKPLPQALLAKMEAAFGADFSAVRVHVGPQAARIGAVAFTMGNDLYFAPGQFRPESVTGQQLIGHELAHVVQQSQGRVRAPTSGVAVVQDRALEAEADRLGMRAAAHRAPIQPKMAGLGRRKAQGHIAANRGGMPVFDARVSRQSGRTAQRHVPEPVQTASALPAARSVPSHPHAAGIALSTRPVSTPAIQRSAANDDAQPQKQLDPLRLPFSVDDMKGVTDTASAAMRAYNNCYEIFEKSERTNLNFRNKANTLLEKIIIPELAHGGRHVYKNLGQLQGEAQIFALFSSGPSYPYYVFPTSYGAKTGNSAELANGEYCFAILTSKKNEILVCRDKAGEVGHTSITKGQPVYYAGKVRFINGTLDTWNNDTGHYQTKTEHNRQAQEILVDMMTSPLFPPEKYKEHR